MKITYASKTPAPPLSLKELSIGEIFRPTNSLEVYMYLGISADYGIITTCDETIKEHTMNIQNFDFDDCPPFEYELLACTSLEQGGIRFFHEDISVEKLDYQFIIKE